MSDRARPDAARPANLDAYNLLLKGRYFLARGSQADAESAVASFQAAIKLEPTYALAWIGLSNAYFSQSVVGWAPTAEGYEKAKDAAERAVKLAPDSSRTHVNLGWVRCNIDWDWAAAKAEFERARALNPDDPMAGRGLARVTKTIFGHPDEEIALRRQELARNPLDVDQLSSLADLLLAAGHPEETLAIYRNLQELNPTDTGAYVGAGEALLAMGRFDEALASSAKADYEGFRLSILPMIFWAKKQRAESDRTLQQFEDRYGARLPFGVARIRAYRGEADAAFNWLNRAYSKRDPSLGSLRIDPYLRVIRQDPRFHVLLVKLKLADG